MNYVLWLSVRTRTINHSFSLFFGMNREHKNQFKLLKNTEVFPIDLMHNDWKFKTVFSNKTKH